MKRSIFFSCVFCIFALLFAFINVKAQTNVPLIISYQGQCIQSDGKAMTGTHKIIATLYSDPNGTNSVWQGSYDAEVQNGIYSILLGSGAYKFPDITSMSRPLWLGIKIDNGDEMLPRAQFACAPYALNVADKSITYDKLADEVKDKINSGINPKPQNAGSQWSQDGDYIAAERWLGSKDSFAIEIHLDDTTTTSSYGAGRVMRYEPNNKSANIIGGFHTNSGTGSGNVVTGGGVSGHPNTISGNFGSVGGGYGNRISGNGSVIAGDSLNNITGNHSVISGGTQNTDTGDVSVISGGIRDTISGSGSVISGGRGNHVKGDTSNISGGANNAVTGHSSNISGGNSDTITGNYSSILGGTNNTIVGDNTAIIGGRNLKLGNKSFGFCASPLAPGSGLDPSLYSNLAFFEDVDLWLKSDSFGYARQVRFGCPGPANGVYTAISAGYQTGYINYVLPGSQAPLYTISALVNDGSGQLSWDSLGAFTDGKNTNWKITGNSNTDPSTNFLGTNNNKAFEIHVNDSGVVNQGDKRVMRYEPNATSANITGGYLGNKIFSKGYGNVIAGGGANNKINRIGSKTDTTLINTFGFLGGGDGNSILDDSDGDEQVQYGNVICGGRNNSLEDVAAFIGGGENNWLFDAGHGLIVGGLDNSINSGDYSLITGGDSNSISISKYGFIGGGFKDSILSSNFSTIIGGKHNQINTGAWSVICGGDTNTILNGANGFIGGGLQNFITTASYCAVLCGSHNKAAVGWSMVGAGDSNSASAQYSAIVSGKWNKTSGDFSFIGAGKNDTAVGVGAFVGSGIANASKGTQAGITGGLRNQALSNFSFIGGGDSNIVNTNNGVAANIPGGENLKAISYAQSVVGYYNKPQGTSRNPTNDARNNRNSIKPLDRVFIVGAGRQGFPVDTIFGIDTLPIQTEIRKNAYEITNNGQSIVYNIHGSIPSGDTSISLTVDTFSVIKGSRSVDNTCIAWGNMTGTSINSSFGVDSVIVIPTTTGGGQYRIILKYVYSDTDPSGTGGSFVNTLKGSSVTATLTYSTTNGEPGNGANLCANIRSSQLRVVNGKYQFDIFIYQQNSACNNPTPWVDSQSYMFHVYARP